MLVSEYQREKIADYLRKEKPARVCIIFWHGLGDLIMFATSFNKLRQMFPATKIDIALQKGVGQESIMPNALLITDPGQSVDGYDYTFQVHFPMSEGLGGQWTKSEWCCKQELGIDPVCSYPKIKPLKSKLVALHFQATALPDPVNPDEETANKIWDEVIEAGFIPIEAFFKHMYYNPVNEKFPFIDATVRGVPADIKKLISLLQSCCASICVASGNFPLSLAVMPDRTFYLQKEYPVKIYTRMNIPSVDVTNYKEGRIKEWLLSIR